MFHQSPSSSEAQTPEWGGSFWPAPVSVPGHPGGRNGLPQSIQTAGAGNMMQQPDMNLISVGSSTGTRNTSGLGPMLPTNPGRSSLLAAPSPATNEFSFLECVVSLLRGSSCLKRKNVILVNEASIWLSPDMLAVKYRTQSKKGTSTDEFLLSKVRKLKATDREISVLVDEKKSLDFILPSREKALIWLSGLCCLVPALASVKSRHKHLEYRGNYDPLSDSWNGKALSSRKCFNEFILLGSIGRGAFGKVKLALSRENRQFYAVKVLSKSMMRKQNRNSVFDRSAPQAVSQNVAPLPLLYGAPGPDGGSTSIGDVNEIAIMRKLDHPNVIRMHGMFDDVENDRLFIVVEFVACGPVMNSSKLTGAIPLLEHRVRQVFIDVLAGLQYLHHHNIVHRDLKPENLLCAGDASVKISDFGAAKMYDDNDGSGDDDNSAYSHRTTVGTPAFTAPELCLSEKSPQAPPRGFPSDIWSLGATLFYMVYGRAPFLAKSVFEMYDAICTKSLEFPDTPSASRHLRDLLTIMLEKSPEKRATFATILHSPWLTENADTVERVVQLRELIKLSNRTEPRWS
jgi:serine/threonine protein kinase